MGAPAALETGSEPDNCRRTHSVESSRSASLSFRLGAPKRRDEDELIETITHLAFYAGWPNAVTAISVAKDVFQKHWCRMEAPLLLDNVALRSTRVNEGLVENPNVAHGA
jgi:Carboxymuconolactone decarboxylase family